MKNSILSFLLFSMIMGLTCPVFSQYKITQFTPDSIRFDSFAAIGLQPIPQAGELNSSHWRIKGLSDGNSIFGGSYSSGDFARGVSTGSVSNGGIYAFDNGSTGRMLGVQPIGSDFTPGSFTLKLQNSTPQVIKDLEIKYTVWFLNNEDRANSFDFYYSFDDSTYTKDTTVNATSLELADTLGWQSYTKISTLKNINIAVGDLIYLQWKGDDATGIGSRDEFGLDNIILTAEEENVVPIASVQIVHNSAAVELDTVDIYMDDSLILDNMLFRTASKFLSIPAETNVRLIISPSNSTDTNKAYYAQSLNLNNGERYVALLNGLWGNGYNPSSSTYPLNLFLKEKIRDISSNVGNTDILFFHGSTDIGPLDIHESSIPAGKIVDNAEYGNYRGYYEYLTDDYSLEVYDSSSMVLYQSYTMMLQSYNLMDSAILVLSSGFDDPSTNNNGENFNMMYVPQIGGAFIPLNSLSSSIGQEQQIKDFLLYPNPAKNHLILESAEVGYQYEIFNVLGEKVLEGKQQSNRTFVDISELAHGTYIVNLQNAAANISKMFVK